MFYISGEAFKCNDKYIIYFRHVTGIVSAQMGLTLAIGFLSYRSEALHWLLQSWLIELLGLIFFLAALCWLLTQKEARQNEP